MKICRGSANHTIALKKKIQSAKKRVAIHEIKGIKVPRRRA